MKYSVGRIVPGKNFDVVGMSYIGAPRPNTAVFITKKIEHLPDALEAVSECLVFAEKSIVVPKKLENVHAFYFSDRP